MKSMTGFGRSEKKDNNLDCTVEVKSVNNRYKDITVRLPQRLNAIDLKIREEVNKRIDRGKIDVFIKYKNNEQGNEIEINEDLAQSYSDALDKLLNYNTLIEASIDLAQFSSYPEIITIKESTEEIDEVWENIKPVLIEALDNLIKSRELEGQNLKRDIRDHLEITKNLLDEVKVLAPNSINEAQNNLRDRLEVLLADVDIDESRFLTEVAVLADKLAIDEEITRLDSHIGQLDELIEANGSNGRKMDFLIQEINREINTIGSKSDDLNIKTDVVDMKAEVEKIREQVQNIE